MLRAAEFQSPVGKFVIMSKSGELAWISLPSENRDFLADEIELVQAKSEASLAKAVDFLRRYFAGEPVSWAGRDIPNGAGFYRKVWEETAKIPFGKTISYGELAAIVGKPGAARAVGTAMARNPLPILIPCHRVITSAGGLGGYGGGLDMKRWLLAHEKVNI